MQHIKTDMPVKQGTKIKFGDKVYEVVACIDLNWLYDTDEINQYVINIRETLQ